MQKVFEYIKTNKPSARGELEIISIHEEYLKLKQLRVEILGRGFAWLDTGNCDSLLQASNFVETVQKRQGLSIACVEEIAYKKGFIDKAQLVFLATSSAIRGTEYGKYLLYVAQNS